MSSTFTIDQITRLREIERARVKRGASGLRADIKELITRLESGGAAAVTSNDIRIHQAIILWNKGWGRKLGIWDFGAYLETIPEIPERLFAADDRFPDLILVDARHSLTKACQLSGLIFMGDDSTFMDFDPTKARIEKLYWIQCQHGEQNWRKAARFWRDSAAADELGLTAMEGVAYYVQKPEIIQSRIYLDLPGSILHDHPSQVAGLGNWGGGPKLSWYSEASSAPCFGAASRRA